MKARAPVCFGHARSSPALCRTRSRQHPNVGGGPAAEVKHALLPGTHAAGSSLASTTISIAAAAPGAEAPGFALTVGPRSLQRSGCSVIDVHRDGSGQASPGNTRAILTLWQVTRKLAPLPEPKGNAPARRPFSTPSTCQTCVDQGFAGAKQCVDV